MVVLLLHFTISYNVSIACLLLSLENSVNICLNYYYLKRTRVLVY